MKHINRPAPNTALLGAFAAEVGVVSLDERARGDPARLSGQGRAKPMSRRRRLPMRWSRPGPPPEREFTGSRFRDAAPDRRLEGDGAHDRALPAAGGLRLSDHAANPYRRGRRRTHPSRRTRKLRVHQRRERIRRALGRHRRFRRRRPRLYRDREPGPPLHGGGRLQRRRPRPADRHDARQSRDRRADQHLERPFRRDGAYANPAGSSSSPRPTRRRPTFISSPSAWPRNCRCRRWSASTASS